MKFEQEVHLFLEQRGPPSDTVWPWQRVEHVLKSSSIRSVVLAENPTKFRLSGAP